ncbi:MAG: SIMPL domain-containing protein [Actinomycetia bacterium]|nr:SIMPL domain-containing protein [Actinomycetes bacterium]
MSTILPSCVDVTGTGAASALPDMVDLDLRITRHGESVSETLREVDQTVQAVRSALSSAGIPDKDVQTTSTGIHQRYDNQGQQVRGFTGFHSLRVGVRDLDQVNSLVEQSVEAAGDDLLIDGIALSISDPEPLLATARERAFDDARRRAEEYARFAGRPLGDVIWIGDDARAGAEPRMYAMRAQSDSAAMSVAPGESTVTASLAVRFAWADTDPRDESSASTASTNSTDSTANAPRDGSSEP